MSMMNVGQLIWPSLNLAISLIMMALVRRQLTGLRQPSLDLWRSGAERPGRLVGLLAAGGLLASPWQSLGRILGLVLLWYAVTGQLAANPGQARDPQQTLAVVGSQLSQELLSAGFALLIALAMMALGPWPALASRFGLKPGWPMRFLIALAAAPMLLVPLSWMLFAADLAGAAFSKSVPLAGLVIGYSFTVLSMGAYFLALVWAIERGRSSAAVAESNSRQGGGPMTFIVVLLLAGLLSNGLIQLGVNLDGVVRVVFNQLVNQIKTGGGAETSVSLAQLTAALPRWLTAESAGLAKAPAAGLLGLAAAVLPWLSFVLGLWVRHWVNWPAVEETAGRKLSPLLRLMAGLSLGLAAGWPLQLLATLCGLAASWPMMQGQ